ncbi:MAG: PIG-L deacetylase family protein [Nanoarchaeota archaeon]
MGKKETIVVFGAHSDDFVIGAGGTLARYVEEGKKVISVVFSFGENSHPWLKEGIVQQMRSKEAVEACNVMKITRLVFYDLAELNFMEEYKNKNVEKELLQLLETEKPTKIFTHSQEDPHPDHKAINQITLQLWEKLPKAVRPEIYTYSIWNPVSFRNNYPSFYVNISQYFGIKLKALKTYRSQKFHIIYPVLLLFFRAIKDGLKVHSLYGERFFRIK